MCCCFFVLLKSTLTEAVMKGEYVNSEGDTNKLSILMHEIHFFC